MNEEQITALAQEGRKQSVQNVQTMIEKTSWIPKRLNS